MTMAKVQKSKKVDPIAASRSIRKSAAYFLARGAKHETEAEALARAELFAESVGWKVRRKTRYESARLYLQMMREALEELSMPKKSKNDLTSASYLAELGARRAITLETEIRMGANLFRVTLPLDEIVAGNFVNHEIKRLDGAGKIDWYRTHPAAQEAFVSALRGGLRDRGVIAWGVIA